MFRRVSVVAALLSSAAIAHAGDKPLYQPVPDWVSVAPAPDLKPATNDAPNVLIFDNQQRIAPDGTVWNYLEKAIRIVSAQALAQAGTITLDWMPDHGDLMIHSVEILRDGQRINALKGDAKFTVLRREAGLEKLSLDGKLSATLAVEDLRVGDVLDVRYSVTSRDPALAGNAAAVGPILAQPIKLGFARTRLLWPSNRDVHWKVFPEGATPQAKDVGGWHELVFALPVARQPDLPTMIPGRFAKPPIVEASTFADWASLSRVMEPLYRTQGLIAPGSPLAEEVAKIAKAESDPLKRTALALALVQEKVRYLYKGMDNGNYVPQKPAETWANRYGDCKAKTLLLLAILHELGVEAEPALANLGAGDLVSVRLPSPVAFNHIFVIATVGGQKLWLDGTATGTHLEDIADVAPFGWVLPVRAQGADLLEAPNRVPARPTVSGTVDLDMSGGIDLPAPFETKMVIRGPMAGTLKVMVAQLGKEEQRRAFRNFVPQTGGAAIVSASDISFDDAAGTALLTLSGVMTPSWTYVDTRYRYEFGGEAAMVIPDRSRSTWKAIPVETGAPSLSLSTMRLHLPDGGKSFTLEGGTNVDASLPGGKHIVRKAALADGVMTLETRMEQTGAEIAPADLPAARAKVAQLRNQVLRVTSVAGYPAPWHGVEAAKKAGKYDKVLARYASYIADRPEEAERYVARARFLMEIFERDKALADLNKAISIQADVQTYAQRAALFRLMGQRDKERDDLKAAHDLDPGNVGVLRQLAVVDAQQGAGDDALALLQERIDAGGEDEADLLSTKASVLAYGKDADAALAASDSAVEKRPGNGALLNGRCWIKGTLNVQLDTALKDCTRAIELSDANAGVALDSRAMVYFRMDKWAEALTDLNAALELRPSAPASLYMRGIVQRRAGNAKAGDIDLASARLLNPVIDEEYARWGIKP